MKFGPSFKTISLMHERCKDRQMQGWQARLTGSRNEYMKLYLSKWGLKRTCMARVGSVIRIICTAKPGVTLSHKLSVP